MATATPNSFPGGVVADSSGVIDPSAPVSICFQPVGGVLGGVVAYSTVMTLSVTDDPVAGKVLPSKIFCCGNFFTVWYGGVGGCRGTVLPTRCKSKCP